MAQDRNRSTQPYRRRPVFNAWDVVPDGWYAVARSGELRRGAVMGVDVARQHLAIWRDPSGGVHAVDGFCPHMGTDLAIGRVEGDDLACFFHHWQFDGTGRCVRVPAGGDPPSNAVLHGWDCREQYGLIWVFPAASAPYGVPEFESLQGKEVVVQHGADIIRTCHHHVCMINGIDVQHLSTVHDIDMSMDIDIREDKDRNLLDITLRGPPSRRTPIGRALHRAFGGSYGYRMRYCAGTVGLLTTLHQVVAFDRWSLPEARMIFAYQPLPDRTIRIRPVFITERRSGATGRVLARTMLRLMALGFSSLRDEDGMIYDNIRFQPRALLPMDAPVARYIAYIDRQPLSPWTAVDPTREPSSQNTV